jgi:hypothetical protein
MLWATGHAYAQIQAPRLTALSRESPANVSPGGKVEFRFSIAAGTVPAQSLRLILRSANGDELRAITVSSVQAGTAATTVDNSWVNGRYEIISVEVRDDWNRTVRYTPGGVVTAGTAINAATSHSFDFAGMGVTVAGGRAQALAPSVTSLEMLSPAEVAPGQSARFRMTGSIGNFPLARVNLVFRHSTNTVSLHAAADTQSVSAEFTLPITEDFATGRYTLNSIQLLN